MPEENVRTTLQFQTDITEFKAAMQEANRAIKLANSEFKAASSGMDDWSKSSDGLSAKLRQLSTIQDAERRKLDVLKTSYEQVAKEQGENSAAAQDLLIKINNQQAAVNKAEKNYQAFASELDKAENAADDAATDIKKAGDAAENAGKDAKDGAEGWTVMRGALSDLVADGIRAAIEGLKELGGSIFNLGKDFTSTMSDVQAISGASGEELEMLTATAREWGAKTVFSASEAAEAMKYMAMAGWSVDQSVAGLPGILNLAAASGADLAEASDIVTDALTGMGYGAEDAGRLADVMAAASSNANTNVEMMGGTFKYAAPLIGALGYSMEDAAVSIGLMANAGIKAEQAGTSLRSILTRLAAPPKEAATAMNELGISITNGDGTMKEMNEVVDDLRAAFAELTEAEQAEMAKKIAGQEAMSGLLAIVNAAPADYEKLTNAVNNSAGAAQKMSDVMNDNLGGDIAEMESALEELGLKIFDSLEEPLRSAVQWITENLNPAFNWIVENKDIIIGAIAGVASGFIAFKTAAAVSGIISGFQQFFSIIKAGQGVMAALNAVMGLNPIGLIAIAIGGLVAAFATLWNTSEGFRNFWISLWEGIKNAFSAVVEWFRNAAASIGEFFSNAWQGIKKAWSGVTNFFGNVKNGITTAFSNIDKWMGDKFGDAWTGIKKAFEPFVKFFEQIWNTVKGIFSVVKSVFSGNFSDAWEAIKGIFSGWGDFFSGLWDKVKSAFANVGQTFLSIGKNIVQGIWNGISGAFTWIKDKITGWIGNVLDFIKGLFGIHSPSTVMRDEVGKMLGLGMAEGITDSKKNVQAAMRGLNEVVTGDPGPGPRQGGMGGTVGGKTIIFNQTNNSPRALSRREIYRQTHNALAFAGGA